MDRSATVEPQALRVPTAAASRTTNRRELLWILLIGVTAGAAYAGFAGQDTNWDLRNYHFYVVYAWLKGRTFSDLAPAQIQSWLSPFPHLLQYLFIVNLPPRAAGMAMGALAGLNAPLLWGIARQVQGWETGREARAAALCMVTVGLTGPLFISMVGTSFAEYLTSAIVLGAVLVLLAGSSVPGAAPASRVCLVTGLLLGAACGLKLTNLVYLAGFSSALVVVVLALGWRLRDLALYPAAVLGGFVLTGGYWSAKLWLEYGSPIFPFFNGLFGSTMFPRENFSDARFLPGSVLSGSIGYPLQWAIGLHPTSEVPFRDLRFALAGVLFAIAAPAALMRLRTLRGASPGTGIAADRTFWFLTVFVLVCYLVWLKQFAIQRYVLPLELLSGVLMFLALRVLLPERWERLPVLILLSAAAIVWTRPGDWGRLPYAETWFDVRHGQQAGQPTLHVMLGYDPTAFVIPFMPPADRFVRMSGNLPLEPGRHLGVQVAEVLAAHRGPVRSLSAGPIGEDDRERLVRFGLALPRDPRCVEVFSRTDRLVSCELTRLDEDRTGT